MKRLTENKIVLIVRKTRLDELIARFNTLEQARFYVEHLGADFSDYQLEDSVYKGAVAATETILSQQGRLQVVERNFLPNFIFGAQDIVVALGQDGLVANVLKYLNGQRLIGVNPDPRRWEGVLLPFQINDLAKILPDAFKNLRKIKAVTMARVSLNTGETLYGVNDLFIGPRSHTSARYHIEHAGINESQSSSGIIVSTGLGSTGWLKSILAGATGITASLSGKKLNLRDKQSFSWDAQYLYYSVREPWPSKYSQASITFGKITSDSPLILVSQMPEHGVIFSDGIESDFLKFNSGTKARIEIADKRGLLVT